MTVGQVTDGSDKPSSTGVTMKEQAEDPVVWHAVPWDPDERP
jgi:hypothetical protein